MNTKHLILTAISALFAVSFAMAQEDNRDVLKSYSYIEAQGGVQTPASDFFKLISPTAALSYGYMTPKGGARLHLNGWQSKMTSDYKYKYIDINADLLLNVTSLLSRNVARPLNLYVLGGIGHISSFDHEANMGSLVDKFSYNLRTGLRLESNITKPIGFSFEINANYAPMIHDKSFNNSKGWGFLAMLGVSYRFNRRIQKAEPIVPVVQEVIEAVDVVPAAPVIEEKKPEPKIVVKKDILHEEIFYGICKSDPTVGGQEQMKKIAQFMEKHKDAKVMIVGYADKETGHPSINMEYANQRAQKCKDVLVNTYGCNPANILTSAKGDTIQPFGESEKNRCAIIDSEIEFTVQE